MVTQNSDQDLLSLPTFGDLKILENGIPRFLYFFDLSSWFSGIF